MKIKDAVVIDSNFINQLINEFTEEIVKCDNKQVRESLSLHIKVINKIISNTKPLKPIVKDAYIKKEFPKYKPKEKGVYISDYNAEYNHTSTWDGEYFISISGGIIDNQITWFLEQINDTEI